MMSESTVKSFHCNNCGAPLVIPKGSKGKVVCPSCRTECVIEGLVKNAEIQAKENINSGMPLAADVGALHERIIKVLTNSPCMPLDLLERVEIVKEEHLCVPAYLFYCNAMGNYTYDAGNIREHKTAIDLGDKVRVEKERYVEWTQMSGSVSSSETLVASGNKQFADVVKKLYMNCSPDSLVDIEELEYPADVNTFDYNMPQASAFNQLVRPEIENRLKQKAYDQLAGKRVRDLTIGSSSVQKDEIVRIFLGIYHIVYVYADKEYSLYISSTGKRSFYTEVPLAPKRVQFLREKTAAIKALEKPKMNALKIAAIVVLILAALQFVGNSKSFIIGILCAAGAGAIIYLHNKKSAEYKAAYGALKHELDTFNAQAEEAVKHFAQKDRALKGIYSPYEQMDDLSDSQYATV